MKNLTTVERRSERELVVTRTINGPAPLPASEKVPGETWLAIEVIPPTVTPSVHAPTVPDSPGAVVTKTRVT
jgi:hypothetical protein